VHSVKTAGGADVAERRIAGAILMAVGCLAAALLSGGCEPDYREAGRQAGELANQAATRAALDPTAAAQQRATDAARLGGAASTAVEEVGARAPTVAAEVGERAPTVAAEAATAAREFSEGAQETGACGTAAMVMIGAGLAVALARQTGG
jgi:hypothetical protein